MPIPRRFHNGIIPLSVLGCIIYYTGMKGNVRRAVVAGSFYTSDPEQLRVQISGFLAEAGVPEGPSPKAIIAPHAGYVYSGPVAGSAYARINPEGISRVVLIGPSHRVPFHGLAATAAASYETPLGFVPLEHPDLELLGRNVTVNETAHAHEHSLEVHVPFLQCVLGDFDLIPLVAGEASKEQVAAVLEVLWGGAETLIVISTDLSHYHDYRTAQQLDRSTSDAILALDADGLGYENACGRIPVSGLLHLAKKKGMHAELVDLRSSGDTAGPKDQVVGYGSYVFC